MSNYIVLLEVFTFENGSRRTQLNLRNVKITDLTSARKVIDKQLKVDGFKYTKKERESYYIKMLTKVDE